MIAAPRRSAAPGSLSPTPARVCELRPANVRFYFDADVLGLAKVIARLRFDATFPGDTGAMIHRHERAPCPIRDPAMPDPEWIPEVAKRGWVIVTRDRRIQEHRAEISAVKEFKTKMVALTGPDARNTRLQLEVSMASWRRIEPLYNLPGPFIYRATRTGVAAVALA